MNTNELKELKEKFSIVKKDLPRRKRIYNLGKSFDYKEDVSLNDEKFWVEMKDNSIKFFSKECDKVVTVNNFGFMYNVLMLSNVFRNLYDFIVLELKYKDDLFFSIQKMTEEEAEKENKEQITGNSYLVVASDNCTMKFKCFELIEENGNE